MSVHQCPQNKSEWDTASQRLQCVDPNSYHCLRTEDGGETEQCLGKVWIQEGMCPEYNSKVSKIDVFSCSHSSSCPTEIYWSNEVYKYPICSKLTSLTTTSISIPFPGDDNFPIVKDQSPNVYIIVSVASFLLISLLIGIVCFILKRKNRNRENTNNEHQSTTECPLLPYNDTLNENTPTTRQPTMNAIHVGLTTEDQLKSDIKDLETYGVLIFISDDKIGAGQRMKLIADSGKLGESQYVSPLDQWEIEEDVSLYLIRQPIGELSSLFGFLRDKMDDIYKRVTSQKFYFVLYFEIGEWQRNQVRFLKYDFFKNARTNFI